MVKSIIKILFLAAITQISLNLMANDIVFLDEGVKKLCVDHWDTNGDGELSETEAAAVTSIGNVFAFKTNISTFDELRYFTGIETIEDNAFYNCSTLQHLIIPVNVSSIKPRSFYGCTSLYGIDIPENVTSIGDYAFGACSSLKELIFHDGVKTIGEKSFYYCYSLESVAIPESLSNISVDAFGYCTNLKNITVDEDNLIFDSREDCNALILTASNTLFLGCQSTIIPESVTTIGAGAFLGCSNLSVISIPESVTHIDNLAFSSCSGLEEITIPCSVNTLGNGAFWGCSSLQSVFLEEGLIAINGNVFRNCINLKSVTIPSSVTTIGTDAFFSCDNLTKVTVLFDKPLSVSASTFSNRRNATLFVPLGTREIFKKASVWKDFKDVVEIYPLGDVNHDGNVNVADVMLTINYVVGNNPSAFYADRGDVNGDGQINITDVMCIVKIIMGDGSM